MARHNKDCTREEHILASNLYCKIPFGSTRAAQASPPASWGSVSLPFHGRAKHRGETPLEPAAGTATLPALRTDLLMILGLGKAKSQSSWN
jgi:hypothetical protein